MKVTHYHRRKTSPHDSIGRVFASIRPYFPIEMEVRVALCPFQSRRVFRRVANTVWAAFLQGDVNHVTGDVHFLTLGLRKDKTILTIHDCRVFHNLTGMKRTLYSYLWYTLPVNRSTVITTISQRTKDELLKFLEYDPANVHVIYNPVSSDFQFSPKPFWATEPHILQVGTAPNKNLRRVARALKGISCHLRIIGHLSDDQVRALRESRIEHSSVADIPDEQVIQEYRESDILVFASTYEGFGLPIIEAQATGRPVVTSNIAPMTEVADGAACLVDPYSVQSIREGVLQIIEEKTYREELVEKGLFNVERFLPQRIARQYADLYRQVHQR